MVRQSPPTSTPPSDPSSRISLSKPFQGFNDYNWLRGVNKPLQQRDYLPISSLKCLTHSNSYKWNEEMKVTIKLTQWVDIQRWRTMNDSMICVLQVEGSRYHVCFLFLLVGELQNELDWSFYSLSSKTNRYSHSGKSGLPFMESGKPDFCYR